MRYYPIFVDLRARKVVVVGGGKVAERKIKTLLTTGANIYLISEKLTDKLNRLVEDGQVFYLGSQLDEKMLEGASLVIAATNNPEVNRQVSEHARARNIFVNAVDQPRDCSFIVPSIVRRGDLMIAVSTSGKSPALAKKIRQDLEDAFGEEYGAFLELMGKIREAVLSVGLSQEEKKHIFSTLVRSGIIDAISRNDMEWLMNSLKEILPPDVQKKLDFSDLLTS